MCNERDLEDFSGITIIVVMVPLNGYMGRIDGWMDSLFVVCDLILINHSKNRKIPQSVIII